MNYSANIQKVDQIMFFFCMFTITIFTFYIIYRLCKRIYSEINNNNDFIPNYQSITIPSNLATYSGTTRFSTVVEN